MKGTKYLMIFFIVAVIGVLWLAYFMFMLSPVASGIEIGSNGQTTSSTVVGIEPGSLKPFVIKRGDGFSKIAFSLEEYGLVRSAKFLKLYVLLSGKADKLKPGLYEISPAMTSGEIIKLLVAGPSAEVTVLIKEGETIDQIDAKLADFGVIDRGGLKNLSLKEKLIESKVASSTVNISLKDEYEFLLYADSLEGFLFPDTYRLFFDEDPIDVAMTLLDNFERKVSPMIPAERPIDWNTIPVLRRGIFTIEEILTMASMIEKEVPDSDERRIVADVIYKRLKADMPLQIDATVDYAKANGEEFNTYEFYGLPAGPIANPGLDAIEAALNPKVGPYWYYLSDPATGETIFSKTFEEHKKKQLIYFK